MASLTARRTLDYVLAGLLLTIPIALLSASFKNPANTNAFDRLILRAASPLQSAAAWVVDGVGDGWRHYVWLVDIEKENDELRGENQRLHRALADSQRAAADAEGLAKLADVRTRLPAKTLGARVVAVGQSPYFRIDRIVIDRGEGEVQPGMPVVAAGGVVGRVRRVYGGYADVTLAVDPLSAIDVVVPRTASRGVLRGLGGDNQYSCKIEYLLHSDEVKEDDAVVTSGLGGVFPRDIPVGRIRKVAKSDFGMYQIVEVAPAVDFAHLSSVLVILAPPPPPDPAAKAKKTPDPAVGMVPR